MAISYQMIEADFAAKYMNHQMFHWTDESGYYNIYIPCAQESTQGRVNVHLLQNGAYIYKFCYFIQSTDVPSYAIPYYTPEQLTDMQNMIKNHLLFTDDQLAYVQQLLLLQKQNYDQTFTQLAEEMKLKDQMIQLLQDTNQKMSADYYKQQEVMNKVKKSSKKNPSSPKSNPINSTECEPETKLKESEPETKLTESEPETKLTESEPETNVKESEPETKINEPETETKINEPETEKGEKKLKYLEIMAKMKPYNPDDYKIVDPLCSKRVEMEVKAKPFAPRSDDFLLMSQQISVPLSHSGRMRGTKKVVEKTEEEEWELVGTEKKPIKSSRSRRRRR